MATLSQSIFFRMGVGGYFEYITSSVSSTKKKISGSAFQELLIDLLPEVVAIVVLL
jgi:hypothetical protein